MGSTFSTGDILARLKELREELVLRQEHLAARLGVDRSTYVRKELGAIPITTEEWLKLAKALGRDPSFFFTSSGKPVMVTSDLAPRERSLVRFYRTLRPAEQDDFVGTVYLRFKSLRRKAAQDALKKLAEA
ncbi:MAG: helix-turn-helix transcriptional regulator [Deltaproteobacteria bacterium]|nr:helix-turn-helix transcriptional regulator [Deltaproteobacteria bacterium]MBZ0220187.1 helix-turn-helix domain-containing protein [Deltaproteobacteria bacterium]